MTCVNLTELHRIGIRTKGEGIKTVLTREMLACIAIGNSIIGFNKEKANFTRVLNVNIHIYRTTDFFLVENVILLL